jgi:hypothetical protein
MQFDVAEVGILPGSVGDEVIAIDGAVQDGGSHLQHEVTASR